MSGQGLTSGWTGGSGGAAPSGADSVHVFPVRVYYEDTDASGIVYHANHLRYAERARTEMLRLLGHGQRGLFDRLGLAFSVRHCEIEYLAPARLDDTLEVHTSLLRVNGASLRLQQSIRRDDTELARLHLRIACVNRDGRPARLPDDIRSAFEPFTQTQ